MGVFIIIILVYWSECNLPAAVGTTSKAIAPSRPLYLPSLQVLYIDELGRGCTAKGDKSSNREHIQTPKGVIRRKGEATEA